MGAYLPLRRDIVVIGGSAGALGPLRQIVKSLPADLSAAILVVLHVGARAKSGLAPLLNWVGAIPAITPRSGDPIEPGRIYVTLSDHHLVITQHGLLVSQRPAVNGSRPSIDVLFESAAEIYGPRVCGVILSGSLADGGVGLASIRAAGGMTIVQDPADARVKSMPRNAIAMASPDYVLPGAEIAAAIIAASYGERERVAS